jgi:hypothetical protein
LRDDHDAPRDERDEPILYVTHDADDHAWQFIGGSGASTAIAMIVGLGEVVDLDPTVMEVADLEPGWQASRSNVGGAWQRRELPREEENS